MFPYLYCLLVINENILTSDTDYIWFLYLCYFLYLLNGCISVHLEVDDKRLKQVFFFFFFFFFFFYITSCFTDSWCIHYPHFSFIHWMYLCCVWMYYLCVHGADWSGQASTSPQNHGYLDGSFCSRCSFYPQILAVSVVHKPVTFFFIHSLLYVNMSSPIAYCIPKFIHLLRMRLISWWTAGNTRKAAISRALLRCASCRKRDENLYASLCCGQVSTITLLVFTCFSFTYLVCIFLLKSYLLKLLDSVLHLFR